MKFKSFPSLISFLFTFILICSSAQAATITVTERADSFGVDLCSLRDAVEFMNSNGTAMNTGCPVTGTPGISDTIILEGDAPYVVSLPDNIGGNVDGDINITDDLLIQGQGMGVTTVTAGYPVGEENRIFSIDSGATVAINDLTVSNGTGFLDGGGVQVRENSVLTLERVHLLGNRAEAGGGAFAFDSTLILKQCLVTGNRALIGGGIETLGDSLLVIDETTIDDNQATEEGGGGIFHSEGGTLIVYNSTISNNRALNNFSPNSSGGGIYIRDQINSTTVITNSTISTNQADIMGGGIFVCGELCAEALSDPSSAGIARGVFLFNDTITANFVNEQGGEGGGIFFETFAVPNSLPEAAGGPGIQSVGLSNTILAQNTAETGPDCFNTLESGDFNIFGTTDGCTNLFTLPNDKIDPNPGLGGLGPNGGPTETHGLQPGSLAIDNGDPAGCDAPDFDTLVNSATFTFVTLDRDQRGFPRPIAVKDPNAAICDVGAFEFQAFGFTVTKDDGLSGNPIEVGTNFDYTITVTNNGPGTATAVTLNDPLPAGMTFVAVTPSQGTCTGGATISCDLGDLAAGETATIVVSVTATETGDFTNIVTITLNNPFQQQLTETAQVTTTVTGVFVEGSGIHCELQRGQTIPSRSMIVFVLFTATVMGIYFMLRHRSNG